MEQQLAVSTAWCQARSKNSTFSTLVYQSVPFTTTQALSVRKEMEEGRRKQGRDGAAPSIMSIHAVSRAAERQCFTFSDKEMRRCTGGQLPARVHFSPVLIPQRQQTYTGVFKSCVFLLLSYQLLILSLFSSLFISLSLSFSEHFLPKPFFGCVSAQVFVWVWVWVGVEVLWELNTTEGRGLVS